MAAKRSRWPWVLGALVALMIVAGYVLVGTPAAPTGQYVIDLAALHRAAAIGPLPDHIEVEKAGTFAFPRTFVVAGDGFRLHPMVLLVHRVVWPDHSLVIDTAMGREGTKKMPGSHLDEASFARVQAALEQASAIVFTHEHQDHVGDIAWSRDNIPLQKGRPFIATLLMKEDRGAVAAQLRALAELPSDVHVVIAHDPVALASDLGAGLYREGFGSR